MKDFAPYNEALELKELGFDEECFGAYGAWGFMSPNDVNLLADEVTQKDLDNKGYNEEDGVCLAPTFSQAFRFFREKHGLFHSTIYLDDNSGQGSFIYEILNKKGNQQQSGEYPEFNTYEEAELACLQKLIQIVKTK